MSEDIENNQPNEPEQPDDQMMEPLEEQIEKGGCLRLYLIVAMILNGVNAAFIFLYHQRLAEQTKIPEWQVYLIGALSILSVISCFAVWKLRKVGVHGFIIVGLAVFALNLHHGLNPGIAIFGLIGPVIMVLLVKPIWKYMK
jgi:hypothetical protein